MYSSQCSNCAKWGGGSGCTYPEICVVGVLGCGGSEVVYIEKWEASPRSVGQTPGAPSNSSPDSSWSRFNWHHMKSQAHSRNCWNLLPFRTLLISLIPYHSPDGRNYIVTHRRLGPHNRNAHITSILIFYYVLNDFAHESRPLHIVPLLHIGNHIYID